MPASVKQIKGKIASVQNVGKITKAMELVSVSKMKKSVQQVEAARPFASEALKILRTISRDSKRTHPLLAHGDNAKNLVIVISSNRGLCGSYNARVAKAVTEYVHRSESKHNSKVEFICVGRYAETAARRLRRNIVASFQEFNENTKYEDTLVLANIVHELYLSGNYWNVVIIYTNFISTLTSKAIVKQILPVKPTNILDMLEEESSEVSSLEFSTKADIDFEPSEAEVLEFVLRRLTDSQIFHALAESLASEHSSRVVAMKNATENANKLADELKLTYNRARQASITQEISEIASGAEAFSN